MKLEIPLKISVEMEDDADEKSQYKVMEEINGVLREATPFQIEQFVEKVKDVDCDLVREDDIEVFSESQSKIIGCRNVNDGCIEKCEVCPMVFGDIMCKQTRKQEHLEAVREGE